MTRRGAVVVICHRPIVRQFLSRSDISHRHERELTAHAEVWFTRMIAEDHRAFPFIFRNRADEQVVFDLDLRGSDERLQLNEGCARDNVAAFHRDYIIFKDVDRGE
jgi:hypothetical protein